MPVDFNTAEARAAADRINAYLRDLIEDRWLSTIILSIHLELEAMLEFLLISNMKEPSKARSKVGFAKKLSLCETAELLDAPLSSALRAVNSLRNELAHRLENKPTLESMFRFIESMSVIHPLQVVHPENPTPINLHTFSQIAKHFNDENLSDLEGLVFNSLRMLKVNLLFKIDGKEDSNAESTL
jgi:hypothetical protein